MKILSAETNLGSATNVSNASVVRLFNSGDDNILVTRKDYTTAVMGSFMVLSGDVLYVEKYYTDTLEGSADVKATKIAYSSMMSFASSGGGSPAPTYTHSVSASSVDEGGSFTTTITTTNVDDGTNLYWELSGTNITSADFSSGALTGTASISSNSATFSHTVDNDTFTEGTETVTIKVYSDSGRNTQVGNTLTVTLADTSTTPVAGYSVDFDGNGDYLQLAASNDLELNAEFTIEAWVKVDDDGWSGTRRTLFANNIGWTGNHFAISLMNSGAYTEQNTITVWDYNANNGAPVMTSYPATVTSSDGWTHVAVTRDSANNTRIFKDGTQVGSTYNTSNLFKFGTGATWIGAITMSNTANAEMIDGKISNLRVVKGAAVYTTSNFTPPTEPLSNISGTVLLCCNGSTTTSATVTPGTITAIGDPTTTTDDPWD